MKKYLLTIAALVVCAAVFAQDKDIDLSELEDLNKIEVGSGSRVETSLELVFPMYFGCSVLTNVNYKGAWADTHLSNPDFLDMRIPKSFVYGLEIASAHIRPVDSPLDVSLGLRWTFMDYTFTNSAITIGKVSDNLYMPAPLPGSDHDYRKSKIHANYFGAPLRVALHFGQVVVYGGASAEILLGGYAKYKRPKARQQITPAFNKFRATIEAGFSYGNLGIFAQYGLTPVFPESLSDARAISFGLVLGL